VTIRVCARVGFTEMHKKSSNLPHRPARGIAESVYFVTQASCANHIMVLSLVGTAKAGSKKQGNKAVESDG
jgi:hypothetical protein